MSKIPRKRSKSAAELAEKFGVSTRTVQRYMSEPREEYLDRAKTVRDKVLELRSEGKKLREISEILDIPYGTVGSYIHHAKKDGLLKVSYELVKK